jgi:hypothetical protein
MLDDAELRRALRQSDQLRTDVANLEGGLEVIMAQLARQKVDLARATLGIIFCAPVITTLLVWWLLAHP